MRLQTMYVDMRPIIVKWLGILLFLAFVALFLASIRPDMLRAAEKAREAYLQSTRSGQFDLGYLDHCMRSSACIKSFLVSWSAPLYIKSFIIASLIFSVFCAAFGLLWRPEVIAMRDTRVNAAKVEESRLKSPTAPKGLL